MVKIKGGILLKNSFLLIILSLISIILGVFIYNSNVSKNHLKPVNTNFKVINDVYKTDKEIDKDMKVKGKNIIYGGPYKIGDTIISSGMAIKVTKIGWIDKLKNMEDLNKSDKSKGYAVFELTIYNQNLLPYEFKEEDISLKYGIVHNNIYEYEQLLSKSGYEQWKYIKESFNMDALMSNTYRKGYIIFPVNKTIQNGGILKIYLQNIPIEFKF